MSEIATMTIHELAPLIQRRQVSPVEVTREALGRIESLDSRLHAFITVRPDQALDEARRAEAETSRGSYRGPLHGIPLGIKDNIAVRGWPTTNGSALMTDWVTDYDATVVARLREAGAVIVGKNNLHEWAMGGTCAKTAFGAVRNPWDETRVPGGSSGGSAAAVSASLIYGSVGTDNKGSIRIPASYCGVVGLKPTYGLVSRFGELPSTSSTTDHLGPIAKDVRDTAVMLNLLAGYDPQDPTSIRSQQRDYTAHLDQGVAGLRVGVPQSYFFEQATPEVRGMVTRAVETLGSLGAEVREVRVPSLQHMPLADSAWVNEARPFLLPYALRGREVFADQSIWDRLMLWEFVRAADLVRAARLRSVICREFQEAMQQVDLLAMPTAMTTAFPIDDAQPGTYPANTTTILAAPFNLVGMPTISVPCGRTPEGLPVGLMLAGRHWEDEVVLRAAYAYEQATTGGYAAPPV